MGKKKPFVDKRNATHYRLVPKSATESSPSDEKRFIPSEEHLEEQHKYGIYFDDDYDYMQHLRDVRETATLQTLEQTAEQERFIIRAPKLQTPTLSTLFGEAKLASNNDDDIFDEDIEEALEGNFEGDIGGGLEDDFISLAGGVVEPASKALTQHRQPTVHYESDGDDEDSDFDDYNSDGNDSGDDEQRAQKEIRCNAPRREIDDRFEQLLEADYHDDQMGELDGDDYHIGGDLEPTDERVKRMIKESNAGPIDDEEASKEWIRQRMRLIEANVVKDDDGMESVEVDESSSKRLKWDCESYATQFTNIYNRPTLIQNPKCGRISRRALKCLDREALKRDEMNLCDMEVHLDDNASQCTEVSTVSTYRPKHETPEQRRFRKQAIKEARRRRRQEKKGNKLAFAEEHRKIVKQRVGQIKTIPIV